jgi:hypothetical protein
MSYHQQKTNESKLLKAEGKKGEVFCKRSLFVLEEFSCSQKKKEVSINKTNVLLFSCHYFCLFFCFTKIGDFCKHLINKGFCVSKNQKKKVYTIEN